MRACSRSTRLLGATLFLACAAASEPGYRFSDPDLGAGPDVAGLQDLRARYPDYFRVIMDPDNASDPDLLPLREDLERRPVDGRNYDALNAVASGYFELNRRGGEHQASYFADNFRAAKVLAVPWRAYGSTEDPALRDAILDFFEDAAFGSKPGARETAPRLARVVSSLAEKESDPARRARIERIVEGLGGVPEE